jgi:hypothetical protein
MKVNKNKKHYRIAFLGTNELDGFIPLVIVLLLALIAIIFLAYLRVHKAQG